MNDEGMFLAELAGDKPWPLPVAPRVRLSVRELQAVRGLSEGKTLLLIAREYGISIETQKDYMAKVRAKLNAATNAEAVYLAAKAGLI